MLTLRLGSLVNPEEPNKRRRTPQCLRAGKRPELAIAQILAWADSYYARMKNWPEGGAGAVFENRNEKWSQIDVALRVGLRGLPGGSSLAKLLARERGKRNPKGLPRL